MERSLERLRVSWCESDGVVDRRDRIRMALKLRQNPSEIRPGEMVPRTAADARLKLGHRFVEAALLLQRQCESVANVGLIRIHGDGAPCALFRTTEILLQRRR